MQSVPKVGVKLWYGIELNVMAYFISFQQYGFITIN